MKPHEQMLSLHRTMRLAEMLVPAAAREAWRAEWTAELSYLLREDRGAVHALAQGMFADAMAMRRIGWANRWRDADWRSPELCLRILFGIFVFFSAVGISQPQLRHLVFSRWGVATSAFYLLMAVFTVPSTLVISRFGACDAYEGEAASMRQRGARWYFLGAKLLLLVLSGYLLSVEITRSMFLLIGPMANFMMLFCGIVFNVIAIGWAFNDQRERCPTCMRLLHSPARMGVPSWTLLSSSATEEMCDRGHGLLHQPEWQTSWFQNARWLQLDRTWHELFRQ
jgi:hypothetical protein